jgi:hypothetical protein
MKTDKIITGTIIPSDYKTNKENKNGEGKNYSELIKNFIKSFNCGCARTSQRSKTKQVTTISCVAKNSQPDDTDHLNALFNELLSIDKNHDDSQFCRIDSDIKDERKDERTMIKRSSLTFSRIFGDYSVAADAHDDVIVL